MVIDEFYHHLKIRERVYGVKSIHIYTPTFVYSNTYTSDGSIKKANLVRVPTVIKIQIEHFQSKEPKKYVRLGWRL